MILKIFFIGLCQIIYLQKPFCHVLKIKNELNFKKYILNKKKYFYNIKRHKTSTLDMLLYQRKQVP